MTVGPAVEPSVSWLDDLPDHLSGHQRVLRALVAAAERDARLRAIQVQGSLGRGDADRLSDLDLGVVVAEPTWPAITDEIPALIGRLGTVVDDHFEFLPGPDEPEVFRPGRNSTMASSSTWWCYRRASCLGPGRMEGRCSIAMKSCWSPIIQCVSRIRKASRNGIFSAGTTCPNQSRTSSGTALPLPLSFLGQPASRPSAAGARRMESTMRASRTLWPWDLVSPAPGRTASRRPTRPRTGLPFWPRPSRFRSCKVGSRCCLDSASGFRRARSAVG